MQKRIAVLGSTGMAGHVVSLYLEELGYEIFRVSRSEQKTERSAAIDAENVSLLSDWLDSINPDIIINCIGLLQAASDNSPSKAILINAYLPRWLEKKYRKKPTRIIHLSTDCVFSGNRGSYQESDLPDGQTVYDRSKALGEINNVKDLTFRMSIIGPDVDPKGTGLFHWFMCQTGEISGYRKVIWNGITTIELARGIDAAIRENLCGVYQLVPQKSIDKYNLLILIRDIFLKNISIIPADFPSADKSLINTRSDFNFVVRSYPEQINDMAKWIQKHSSLYPHYFGMCNLLK